MLHIDCVARGMAEIRLDDGIPAIYYHKLGQNRAARRKLTVLGVLHFADAAVGRGALVVVLGQRQRADPRPGRRFGTGSLRLIQPAVVVAVQGSILQILRLAGSGEGHPALRQLGNRSYNVTLLTMSLTMKKKKKDELWQVTYHIQGRIDGFQDVQLFHQ